MIEKVYLKYNFQFNSINHFKYHADYICLRLIALINMWYKFPENIFLNYEAWREIFKFVPKQIIFFITLYLFLKKFFFSSDFLNIHPLQSLFSMFAAHFKIRHQVLVLNTLSKTKKDVEITYTPTLKFSNEKGQ